MEECCTPQCRGTTMIVLGLVLILATIYTTWNIWVVLGALAIIAGLKHIVMPVCACNTSVKKKK